MYAPITICSREIYICIGKLKIKYLVSPPSVSLQTRGLLSHLDNEAQLSVVLGHEIGHVIAHHASHRAIEQQMGQIALIGGAIGGELLELPVGDILGFGSMAAQMLFLSYSREDERVGPSWRGVRLHATLQGS